jgi:hypothetical protein
MTLVARGGVQIELPHWRFYDQNCHDAHRTGVFAAPALVNRFRARYRFARAFRGLDLDGYGESTRQGYEAIIRVSLHWSAFETMLKALCLRGDQVPDIVARYPHAACGDDVRRADPDGRFVRFLLEQLEPYETRLRGQLEAHLAGNEVPATALSKSIRHIFLHGLLTPNAKQVDPRNVQFICNRLARGLHIIMDGEFSRAVAALFELLLPPEEHSAADGELR